MAGTIFNGKCDVSGSTVLMVTQKVPLDETYWKSFGYVVALFAGFRLSVMLLMYFPVDQIVFYLKEVWNSPNLLTEVIASHLKIEQLEQRVARLINREHSYTRVPVTPKLNPVADADGEVVPVVVPQTAAEVASAEEKCNTRLTWTNLDLVLKKGGKKLIDNVSGSVRAGKVLALMGPSGAGKTTLLNALANRAPYANVTGDVTFGGAPLTSRDLMYVPQFDEIKGFTTVVEQIELVGLMKCNDRRAMRRRLVKLLQILGLFEKANSLCKDLTGGELKRLSVGLGMISSPKVLFLDEPTSGLDSTAA
jgi:ABC-type glutathione transport system ATPase component